MKHLQESKSLRQDLCDVNSNNVSWSILSICGMPNISGLYSQSTGLPPSDWKIIQALRFLCSDAVFFRQRTDIEDDDENMPSSSHDDASSDSEEESTEYDGSSSDDYVERSFQVLFIAIDDVDIPEVV